MENKLVIGVIGLGMGSMHLQGAINCGAEIEAICDTNPERLAKVGSEKNIPVEKQYTDWQSVLTQARYSRCLHPTPHLRRVGWSVKLLNSTSKHALVHPRVQRRLSGGCNKCKIQNAKFKMKKGV